MKPPASEPKTDSEDGGDRGGTRDIEGKEVRGLREIDGFLDVAGNNASEEVSVDGAGPEHGGNGNEGKGRRKILGRFETG
jgi:hypothetical protein